MTTNGRHRKDDDVPGASVLDSPGADELRAELLVSAPSRWDRASAWGLSLVVVGGCCYFLTLAGSASWHSYALAAYLVAVYVLGFRTEFPAATGAFVATEPVMVAMVFALPWGWAPSIVLIGVLIGSHTSEDLRFPIHSYLLRIGNAIHCLGPVAVLTFFGTRNDTTAPLAILVLALVAQIVVDGGTALVRGAVQGVPPRQMARPLLWTFSVDALLAPIGFCIVATAQDRPWAYLLLATPIVLIRLMQADREAHRKQAEQIRTAYTEVREQAQLDPLTGLHNRRAWDEAVTIAAVDVSRPERRSAIVIVADVDHLKLTNDTLGHDAGDVLIQEIGHVLTDIAPSDAMVARLGGDEFGVLFTVSTGYLLPDFAVTARALMERATLRVGHPVSASLGVAVCPPGGSVEDAVRRADHSAAVDKAARRVNRMTSGR